MSKEETAVLKELIDGSIQNGYSPLPVNDITGTWVLGLGALTISGLDLSQKKSIIIDEPTLEKKLLSYGDFLISRSNTREKVGMASLFKGGLDSCIYPDLMMRFRVNAGKININYLDHFLRSPSVQGYFSKKAAGTSGSMVKITKATVEKLPVFLPALEEQKAIADILSTWDEAIEKIERLIHIKNKEFYSYLVNFLNRKKCFKNESVWEKKAFKDIFTPIKKINKDNVDYEVLSVTKDGIVRQSEYFSKAVASENKGNYLIVEKGTLAMSGLNFWMGAIDFQDIIDVGIVSPAYKTFKLNQGGFNKEYLHFYIRSPYMKKHLLDSSVQGASVVRRNLDNDMLMNSVIYLPTLKEQEVIAETLNNAQKEIKLLKLRADKYKEQKRGLMQKLLTGKWRIKIKEENHNE